MRKKESIRDQNVKGIGRAGGGGAELGENREDEIIRQGVEEIGFERFELPSLDHSGVGHHHSRIAQASPGSHDVGNRNRNRNRRSSDGMCLELEIIIIMGGRGNETTQFIYRST